MPPPPPPVGGVHPNVARPVTPAEQRPVGPFPPPTDPRRSSDVANTFSTYKHASECGLSSRDLHIPFAPLCESKESVLAAIGGGGRPGFDKPFIPLDCDMRWYATVELCDIMSRFGSVIFIGDSLMRHIVEAMYVYLREDIGYGAIAEWAWEPNPEADVLEKEDCMCGTQTGKRACSDLVIADSNWLVYNTTLNPDGKASSASKLACPLTMGSQPPLQMHYILSNSWPASDAELTQLDEAIAKSSVGSTKPIAFVMHSTFWNNVNTTETTSWVAQLHERIVKAIPEAARRPELFVTANAGGLTKMQRFLSLQNNQAIGNLERDIEGTLHQHGIDMLGCYNMSLQATSSDGTHANLEGNLLKAMSVLNWLEWVSRGVP